MPRTKDSARKELLRMTVWFGIMSLLMLGLLPLVILWPEKPDWPTAMIVFTYVSAGLMSLIPIVATYRCYRSWRKLVDLAEGDDHQDKEGM